jgi:hypothetical protein
VAEENTQPTLRIVLPGHPTSDRAIEIIFPEHVTVRQRGSTDANPLYLFQPGQYGERPPGQHVDPQAALSPGEEAILETKLLVVRGSLDDVFEIAMQQRNSLEQ